MTKNILILIALLLITFDYSYSQLLPGGKRDKYENNVKTKRSNARFYSGIGLRGINAMDDWGVEFSIKFGSLISKNISLGLVYNGILSKNLDIPNMNGEILRMQSFTIQPEYLFWLDKYFLLSIYANGGMAFVSTSGAGSLDLLTDPNGDWAFQSEQGVTFNYRMQESVWLSLEAGYRSIFGVDYKSFGNSEVSGLTFGVTLRAFMF